MPPRKGDRLPGIFEKQAQLYVRPLPPDQLSETAKLLEERGLKVDAVEYYRIAGDQVALERLRAAAMDDGDLFLYRIICKAQVREPVREELDRLGFAARSKGKIAYAEEACRGTIPPQDTE